MFIIMMLAALLAPMTFLFIPSALETHSLLLVLQASICTYLLVPDTIFKQKELRLELNKLLAFFFFPFHHSFSKITVSHLAFVLSFSFGVCVLHGFMCINVCGVVSACDGDRHWVSPSISFFFILDIDIVSQ